MHRKGVVPLRPQFAPSTCFSVCRSPHETPKRPTGQERSAPPGTVTQSIIWCATFHLVTLVSFAAKIHSSLCAIKSENEPEVQQCLHQMQRLEHWKNTINMKDVGFILWTKISHNMLWIGSRLQYFNVCGTSFHHGHLQGLVEVGR